ncbi:unnamed protein product, partial [Oikopleura dioica]
TMLIQADNNLTELADLQQKKKERTRIAEMMENGDRVSKTEELIFTKSQLIDEEISDLQKRDLALMTENEKLYEKVEQAKRSLRDHVINKMKATHAEEENGVCYKVGSAACLLQPAQEDEKTVGALWVNFFKENDLRTLTTAKVMPLLRRYVEAIPRSNPDRQRVQDALDLLRDHPECPRFQFYEKVKLTMNPSNMQVFVDAVNNIYDNEEHRTDLNNSMDQQRCARQLFTQKRTSHHLEKSLMKEFYEHRNTMSAEQVEELGITADMIRKYEKRGQRDRQSNRGRNNRPRPNNSNNRNDQQHRRDGFKRDERRRGGNRGRGSDRGRNRDWGNDQRKGQWENNKNRSYNKKEFRSNDPKKADN